MPNPEANPPLYQQTVRERVFQFGQVALVSLALTGGMQEIFHQEEPMPSTPLGSHKREAKEYCERETSTYEIPIFDVQELGARKTKECLRSLV